MKDIEFRAWNVKKNVFIFIIGFVTHRNETRIWYLENTLVVNQSFKPSMIIIEQYTGYFESFKGDKAILSAEEPYASEQFSTDYDWTFEGIVKMTDGMWVVEDDDQCCIPFCDILNSDINLKIIGNIHETP